MKKTDKNIYRTYILVRYKIGLSTQEIFDELKVAYPDVHQCDRTVDRWMTSFSHGTEDLQDLERPGRPITAVTQANIETVRPLIVDNVHFSYSQIEEQLSLSIYGINKFLHAHLLRRKISSR